MLILRWETHVDELKERSVWSCSMWCMSLVIHCSLSIAAGSPLMRSFLYCRLSLAAVFPLLPVISLMPALPWCGLSFTAGSPLLRSFLYCRLSLAAVFPLLPVIPCCRISFTAGYPLLSALFLPALPCCRLSFTTGYPLLPALPCYRLSFTAGYISLLSSFFCRSLSLAAGSDCNNECQNRWALTHIDNLITSYWMPASHCQNYQSLYKWNLISGNPTHM